MVLTKWSFLTLYFFLLIFLEFQAIRIGDFRLNLMIFIFFSFLSFVFLLLRSSYKLLYKDKAVFLFLLYISWCTLSYRWSFIGIESLFHSIPIWLTLLLAVSFSNLELEYVIKKWLRMGVVIMAFCWVLAFLLPSFAVLPDVVWRLNGFFAHSQRLALFSAASALIATVFYLNALKSKEYNDIISTRILKFIIFFSFVTLAATQARAFTMSFMITYALLLYAHYKSHVKVVYIIFIITSSFIVYANIDFIMETFSRGDVADASLTGRVPTWLFAIELIEEQPLYGYGFGSFFSDLTIEPGRQYVSPHAHNSWINASLETGYVGAILMSLFLVFSISNAIKYQKVTKKLSYSLFIIIFILFCGLTGVVIGGKVTTLLGFSLLVYSIEMRALKNAC